MFEKASKKLQIIVAGLLSVAIFVIFHFFNPEKVLFFPKCPFLSITGYQCPGCGSQRAIHELLHFDIIDAFRYNPLVVLAFPYIVLGVYMAYFDGEKAYPSIQSTFFGKRAAIIIILSIVGFWIGRNLL